MSDHKFLYANKPPKSVSVGDLFIVVAGISESMVMYIKSGPYASPSGGTSYYFKVKSIKNSIDKLAEESKKQHTSFFSKLIN